VTSEDGSQVYVLYNPPQESATVTLPEANYTVFTSIGDINAQGRPDTSVLTIDHGRPPVQANPERRSA
jgi:hypothetical protein